MSGEMKAEYKGRSICEIRQEKSGVVIQTDASVNAKDGAAFSPTDMLASALASCTLSMIGFIAERDGYDLSGTQAVYEKELVKEPVLRVGKIKLHIAVHSDKPLDAVHQAKLEAAARACPVRQSLHPDVNVDETFEYIS